MRTTYAFYTENFEIYQFKYKTYGAGVTFDPDKGETYDDAIDEAQRQTVAKCFKDNPHLKELTPSPKVTIHPSVIQVDLKGRNSMNIGIQKEIDLCKDLETLESYKLLRNTSPEAKEAYDKKLNELTNGKA